MSADSTPRTKSQTLSLRLDPKTRFVLEFLAKLNRQSITTVVEEAIRKAGEMATVGGDPGDFAPRNWRDFWDVSEGVRTLKMLSDSHVPSNYEDDEVRDFVKQHIAFFSASGNLADPDRLNVQVLWPRIADYLGVWHETGRRHPFEVGAQMSDTLREAGIDPPQWPPPKKPSAPKADGIEDLDDEIPF